MSKCILCRVSMKEENGTLICPECGRTKNNLVKKEGKEFKPKKSNAVIESKKIGNLRIVRLKNGDILKIGPRPPQPYFS